MVEVAGKRLMTEPQYVTIGYHGQLPEQNVSVKSLGAGTVEIDARENTA